MQFGVDDNKMLILKEALRQTELKFVATDEIAKLHDLRFFQLGAVFFVIIGFLLQIQRQPQFPNLVLIYSIGLSCLGFYAFMQNAPRQFKSLGHYWQGNPEANEEDWWKKTYEDNVPYEQALIEQAAANTNRIYQNQRVNAERGRKFKDILWIWIGWSGYCIYLEVMCYLTTKTIPLN